MTTRCNSNNAQALDAFPTAKAQIDTMLLRLKVLSYDHFETHSEEISWAEVGTLNHYAIQLQPGVNFICGFE